MKSTVTADAMLNYLQSMLDYYGKYYKGKGGEYESDFIRNMCACKDMVEALIDEPVNLQRDGKVTTGF